LTDNVGIVVGARESESGAQLVYIVPNVARVFVKFDCISSVPGEPEDVLKITAIVLNRGKRADTFALKAVLDTVLGERTGTHFSTAQNLSVNSEMQFRSVDAVRWICSENKKASMRIMVYGADCSPVEVVSLGNKDLLALPAWIPSASRAKTFDSVLSYNNSAVCINWQGVRLAPEEEASFVYYISMATDGREPAGDGWLAEFSPESLEAGLASDADGAARERNVVRFDVEPVGVERLDYEYVQELLDRINTLESGSASVDREELLRLNAELDAVLEKLR
ncbi:MAG: hypothetical protein K2H09_09795, partial [Treponemataceae bacterium]|nr:hypothetical protein [Treponemataceae bacterium]